MSGPNSASGNRNSGGSAKAGGNPPHAPMKRWDGAARTCNSWDGLRRDPELWFNNGNCLVYLYGKGQSRRGPSFKVPFRHLLESKCYPLIEKFIVTPGLPPRTPEQIERWSQLNGNQQVELYIPSAAGADRRQALKYHIATRNFFAWIFRRSMVGNHLGAALVGLLYSMYEFRSEVDDHITDLTAYLDEEGYVDVANKPDYALAMLHLAETFRLRELYIRAFAHCVGMSERLHTSPEYTQTSYESKRLIRQERSNMDSRIYAATDMLNTFLDDELSETHLGIAPGARAHLERFRSYILSHYTSRLGYYPPRSFEPSLLHTMRNEFEALYKLLVDDAYVASTTFPPVASGGMCTLQLIQAFDRSCKYEPLEHPLSMLPDFCPLNSSRLIPWRSRASEKLKPDDRLLAHAALVKASNWKKKSVDNELVKAYRVFEEDCVMRPSKVDKQDKVSLTDARKTRWILIYAVYQVLRSVTEVAPEVYDAIDAMYHVAVNTENLPPWKADEKPLEDMLHLAALIADESSNASLWDDSTVAGTPPARMEIKPDVDYFAITHRDSKISERRPSLFKSLSSTSLPGRKESVSRALNRNSAVRRSIMVFKAASLTSSPNLATSSPKPAYHEIVVHGYGNGTNKVKLGSESPKLKLDTSSCDTLTSLSTISNSDDGAELSSHDSAESVDTFDSVATPFSDVSLSGAPMSSVDDIPLPLNPKRRNVVSMIINPTRMSPVSSPKLGLRRSISGLFSASNGYSQDYEDLVAQQRQSFFGEDHETSRRGLGLLSSSASKRSKGTLSTPRVVYDDDWASMQAFMDGDFSVKPVMEQLGDLGGLTEMGR